MTIKNYTIFFIFSLISSISQSAEPPLKKAKIDIEKLKNRNDIKVTVTNLKRGYYIIKPSSILDENPVKIEELLTDFIIADTCIKQGKKTKQNARLSTYVRRRRYKTMYPWLKKVQYLKASANKVPEINRSEASATLPHFTTHNSNSKPSIPKNPSNTDTALSLTTLPPQKTLHQAPTIAEVNEFFKLLNNKNKENQILAMIKKNSALCIWPIIAYDPEMNKNIDMQYPHADTLLQRAAYQCHPNLLVFLLEKDKSLINFSNNFKSPLLSLLDNNNIKNRSKCLKILLDNGADPLLHYPSQERICPLIEALRNSNKIAVKILLDKGAYLTTRAQIQEFEQVAETQECLANIITKRLVAENKLTQFTNQHGNPYWDFPNNQNNFSHPTTQYHPLPLQPIFPPHSHSSDPLCSPHLSYPHEFIPYIPPHATSIPGQGQLASNDTHPAHHGSGQYYSEKWQY